MILIYAGLILGGAGSMAGAVLGAVVVEVMLDGFLRSTTEAGYFFYGLILLTLVVKLRPWRRLAAVLGATIVLGFVLHAIVEAISASALAGAPRSTGWIASALHDAGYRWDQPAYSLSYANRRRLEIARAGHPAAAAAARRARRGHEPERDPRGHRADRRAA